MKTLIAVIAFLTLSSNAYSAEEVLFSKWEFVPQASILTPTRIELVPSNLSIPYDEILAGFPALHLGLLTPLVRTGDFLISGIGKIGFSYKRSDIYTIAPNRSMTKSDISLLWVPASIGTKIQYTHPEFPYLHPSISFGIGTEFVRQNSSNPELTTRAWVPYYTISPMLGFFEGGDSFNGFTFGLTYMDSFAVVQQIRSWSFDLSINILL